MRYRIGMFGLELTAAAERKRSVRTTPGESRAWADILLLPPRLSKGTLLSLLLVGALLLCHHGVFGALHQLPESKLTSHLAAEHTSHPADHGSEHEHSVGSVEHAALYLPVVLYLAYSRLLRCLGSRPRLAFSSPRLVRRSPLAAVGRLPEGPVPSLLGVFRL